MNCRRWRWLVPFALALVCGCRPRPRSGTFESKGGLSGAHGKVIEIDLADGAPESLGSGSVLFQLPPSRTYVGLVRALERAEKDEDVTGVFVRLGTEELGWARSEEIGHLLHRLGKQHKPVVCHADALTNSSAWLLAAGCDCIWLSPAAEVDTVGIAAQMVYLKGALDKLKVETDFIHMGKYKSAAEPITREGPSEPARILADRDARLHPQDVARRRSRLAQKEGHPRGHGAGPVELRGSPGARSGGRDRL